MDKALTARAAEGNLRNRAVRRPPRLAAERGAMAAVSGMRRGDGEAEGDRQIGAGLPAGNDALRRRPEFEEVGRLS